MPKRAETSPKLPRVFALCEKRRWSNDSPTPPLFVSVPGMKACALWLSDAGTGVGADSPLPPPTRVCVVVAMSSSVSRTSRAAARGLFRRLAVTPGAVVRPPAAPAAWAQVRLSSASHTHFNISFNAVVLKLGSDRSEGGDARRSCSGWDSIGGASVRSPRRRDERGGRPSPRRSGGGTHRPRRRHACPSERAERCFSGGEVKPL